MSHTPAPWHVGGPEKCTIYDSRDQRIANSFDGVMVTQRSDSECAANARLIAAAPELLEAQTMGAELNTPDFLEWIAARLINYGDSPNADFILSLRDRAKAGRAAIAKATEGK